MLPLFTLRRDTLRPQILPIRSQRARPIVHADPFVQSAADHLVMARRSCLAIVVRICNLVVTAIGCGLIAYGGYLAAKFGSSYALYGSILALGALNAAFGAIILTCGYRNLFLLRLYGFVLGLLEIAQAAVATLFMVRWG